MLTLPEVIFSKNEGQTGKGEEEGKGGREIRKRMKKEWQDVNLAVVVFHEILGQSLACVLRPNS